MSEKPLPSRPLGHARAGTSGQTLGAQLEQLRAAGCARIYREKATGTRPDRLARSTFDLFAIVKQGVDAGAQFRSLAEPWVDTAASTGRLMIAVLGGLAKFERELIRARTGEGRARAVARGVKLGRKPKLTQHQQKEALRRRERGEETLAEIGRGYNVSGWTIPRLGR